MSVCDAGLHCDCHAKCPVAKGTGEVCGGHGYCATLRLAMLSTGLGLVCDPEWDGPTCEDAQCENLCLPRVDASAPAVAWLRLCHKEKCYCRAGSAPPACATKECPSQCSGHGVCDDVTDPNNQSACDPGFGGEDCRGGLL